MDLLVALGLSASSSPPWRPRSRSFRLISSPRSFPRLFGSINPSAASPGFFWRAFFRLRCRPDFSAVFVAPSLFSKALSFFGSGSPSSPSRSFSSFSSSCSRCNFSFGMFWNSSSRNSFSRSSISTSSFCTRDISATSSAIDSVLVFFSSGVSSPRSFKRYSSSFSLCDFCGASSSAFDGASSCFFSVVSSPWMSFDNLSSSRFLSGTSVCVSFPSIFSSFSISSSRSSFSLGVFWNSNSRISSSNSSTSSSIVSATAAAVPGSPGSSIRSGTSRTALCPVAHPAQTRNREALSLILSTTAA
mmetsp:Transcript_15605/g.36099  ORF Transcript_15605/g.36099 Transcript_15605/m.36099 type:complete len:302 (+) Transcript_15605:1828-2733(+)